MGNYPTSDVQHVARMLLKVRAGDQISVADAKRLEDIADVGHSDSTVPVFVDPDHPSATRAGQV